MPRRLSEDRHAVAREVEEDAVQPDPARELNSADRTGLPSRVLVAGQGSRSAWVLKVEVDPIWRRSKSLIVFTVNLRRPLSRLWGPTESVGVLFV